MYITEISRNVVETFLVIIGVIIVRVPESRTSPSSSRIGVYQFEVSDTKVIYKLKQLNIVSVNLAEDNDPTYLPFL